MAGTGSNSLPVVTATYSASSDTVAVALEPAVTCKLCLMEKESHLLYQLRSCECVFCHACMVQYACVMIREGILTIGCPDPECRHHGELQECEIELLVNACLFKKYQKFKEIREVEVDPLRTFCPALNCGVVCAVPSSSDAATASDPLLVICPNCGVEFCSVCKAAWHADSQCEVPTVRHNLKHWLGASVNASDMDAPIKRCPNCHVPIERNTGCAQMMCTCCKHMFCWYCQASLDNDFMLRHYDNGPCRHRLGHSRASIFIHRAQVVVTFTGLGVLLLVASPILLLTAPCILCCKWKKCTRHNDDQLEDTSPDWTSS